MTIQWRNNLGIVDVIARLRIHAAELVGELVRPEGGCRLCRVRGPEASSSHWSSRSADGPRRGTSTETVSCAP
ncbi:hypothetical protein ACQPZZ_20030 [Microbispora sp. CA-135349]|uniref:hypothetical protein n=1 Tax=Microbispora sp. CA-135349 TaxID=3239953 RepID=UPI003D9262A9